MDWDGGTGLLSTKPAFLEPATKRGEMSQAQPFLSHFGCPHGLQLARLPSTLGQHSGVEGGGGGVLQMSRGCCGVSAGA